MTTNGKNGKNGNGDVPLLPRWFALKGPRPGWLAEHWSLILAGLTALIVFVNTVIFAGLPTLQTEAWVNAAMAWLAAGALYLEGRQKTVTKIAKWRQQVRDEEAAKREPPPEPPT